MVELSPADCVVAVLEPKAAVVNVLLVNVWVAANVTTVSLEDGNVIVVESVPANINVLLTVNVLPSKIVNVEPVAGAVNVTLLMVVAEATPRTGVTKVGVLLKTATPVPVSSDKTPANWAEVVAANWLRFPVVAKVLVVAGSVTVNGSGVSSWDQGSPIGGSTCYT